MDGKSAEHLIEFLKFVGRLKKVDRTGWVTWKSLNIENPESVADHTFRTALLSMLAADIKNSKKTDKRLDVEKILRMALLHEIGESIIGDWDYYAKKKLGSETKERKEMEAVKMLLSLLPEELGSDYWELFEELSRNETPEAKLVNSTDVLEMCVQAVEYVNAGYDKEKLKDFCDGTYTPKMKELEADADIGKLLELLRKEIGFDKTKQTKRQKFSNQANPMGTT